MKRQLASTTDAAANAKLAFLNRSACTTPGFDGGGGEDDRPASQAVNDPNIRTVGLTPPHGVRRASELLDGKAN
jgi:hypothetical protein